jgi:hypothetical protein
MAASESLDPLESDANGGLAFAEVNSQLYLSQKADDPSANITACLPPEQMMPRAKVLSALCALRDLYAELRAIPSAPFRIFCVRDRPLYESLKEHVEDLEPLKIVTNYLLLPKELSAALEACAAVSEVLPLYQEEFLSYDVSNATEDRPRSFNFLCERNETRALVGEALRTLYQDDNHYITKVLCAGASERIPEDEEDMYNEDELSTSRVSVFHAYDGLGLVPQAFRDGLTGEPLSEFGYPPSKERVAAYAATCVLTDREVPFQALHGGPGDAENRYMNDSPTRMAAFLGRIDILQELAKHAWSFADETFEQEATATLIQAARGDQIDVLKYAYGARPSLFITSDDPGCAAGQVLLVASASNRKTVIRWLLDEVGLRTRLRRDPEAAAAHGVSAVWDEDEYDYEWREQLDFVVGWAAHYNDFELVKELCSLGCDLPASVTSSAVQNGNEEMLLWALENGCDWGHNAAELALKRGNMHLFGLCRDRGAPIKPHVLLAAACVGFSGNVGALEDMLGQSPQTVASLQGLVEAAVSKSLLQVLIWLQARLPSLVDGHGKPFDECEVFTVGLACAVDADQPTLLSLLVELLRTKEQVQGDYLVLAMVRKNCPAHMVSLLQPLFDSGHLSLGPSQRALQVVFERNALNAAKWLFDRGVRADFKILCRTACEAAAHGESVIPLYEFFLLDGKLPPLKDWPEFWQRQWPKPSTTYACENAAKSGSVRLVEYLINNGAPIGPAVMTAAAARNRVPLLRWLHSRFPSWEIPAGSENRAKGEGAAEAVGWILERRSKEARAGAGAK